LKLLVAIKSSRKDLEAGHHQAIRETWGKDFPFGADVRFFLAQTNINQTKDEVQLFIPDDGYDGLPFKTRAICHWMVGKTYTHVFLCDNDTFLIPSKLLKSGFEQYDYCGYINETQKGNIETGERFPYTDERNNFYPEAYPWASGGYGYFLSRNAAREVASAMPMTWAEDMFVGQVLGPEVFQARLTAANIPIKKKSSWHLPKVGPWKDAYDGDYMRAIYASGDPDGFINALKITQAAEMMKK
jgi:hypothetical protein